MKCTYFFGDGKAEGKADMRNLLGGKGANLAEMARIGLPVPAGFTITTEVCTQYDPATGSFPEGLKEQVKASLAQVEDAMGARFGDPKNPLLLSVRSGARVSMPGMMDTVLNLGLNGDIVSGLIEKTNNPHFVYDCYRRLIQMYGDVVLGLKPRNKHEIDPFEHLIEVKKRDRGVKLDLEFTAEDLRELSTEFQELIQKRLETTFPTDPEEQLWGAIGAVFSSWNNERAQTYRMLNNIPEDWGTAVNVQAMVYGNRGPTCGTGVAFTRDPALGEKRLYGEFLMNAQGEDVVAGIRTPQPLTEYDCEKRHSSAQSLETLKPEIFKQLDEVRETLEKHFGDMQDLEFTIEDQQLWLLQTRTGKRNGLAAIRIAVEMVEEGLITPEEALLRIHPEQHLGQLLQPVFEREAKAQAIEDGRILAKGLAAGPGAATGRLTFSAQDAEVMANRGEPVLLARIETSPEDIKGMAVAKGILTARGGATSHAALVARQMGKVCVAGCDALDIHYGHRKMRVGDRVFSEGDWISLDGFEGEVLQGRIPTQPSEVVQVLIEGSLALEDAPLCKLFNTVMGWAEEYKRLGVKTNADQPDQAKKALALGAKGIGLCRTEHMFFQEGRIEWMREMILAENKQARLRALSRLEPLQEKDFYKLFMVMEGHPVTIRLLDPPLHEFIPTRQQEIQALAERMGWSPRALKGHIRHLEETNPMLGHRGCRLLISYPEIARMQASAIIRAACRVRQEGHKVDPKIMIPLVSMTDEVELLRGIIQETADQTIAMAGVELSYQIGTMIELPRACVRADEIAKHADFFSFGTNDLTQMTFGFSRDDAGKFFGDYRHQGLLRKNPFQTLDQQGVGFLMQIAKEKGCAQNPALKLGICGEHGGDPASVTFCHELGLDDVSCSPFRVPIAILSAAQAALQK